MRLALAAAFVLIFCVPSPDALAQDGRPPLVTARQVDGVRKAEAWLAGQQNRDGSWSASAGARGGYPIAMTSVAGLALLATGNTPSRGKYASNVRRAVDYLIDRQQASGVFQSPSEMRTMHGHGYAMLFLGEVYGMTGHQAKGPDLLHDRLREVLVKAVDLTAKAQTAQGGFGYEASPSRGDEGSVTVTQIQGLRACMNAGIDVPREIIDKSYRYLEICQGTDGGIAYSYATRTGGSRPALTAAAIATLYSQSNDESEVAKKCWHFIETNGLIKNNIEDPRIRGFFMYSHFYISQVAYIRGGDEWKNYFPQIRELLLNRQNGDGSWQGEGGAGLVFGTSLAIVILQLPYKYLPIFDR